MTGRVSDLAESVAASHPKATLWPLNLALFLILGILCFLWFQRHLSAYWVTVGLSLGALVTLAWALIKFALGENLKTGIPRILGSELSPMPLALGIVLLRILLATTASVYIVADETPSEAIVVHYSTTGLQGSFELTADSKIAGRPFLFHWRRQVVAFEVLSPPYHWLPPRELRPGDRLRLHFRYDFKFKTKRLHMVQVLAGWRPVGGMSLYHHLPAPESAHRSPAYNLLIHVRGGTHDVPDLRQNGVMFGASDQDLRCYIGQDHVVHDRRKKVERDLDEAVYDMREAVDAWLSEPRFLDPATELGLGDALAFELRRTGEALPLATARLVVAKEPGIEVVFLQPEVTP